MKRIHYILCLTLALCSTFAVAAQGKSAHKKELIELHVPLSADGRDLSGTYSVSVCDAAVVKPDSTIARAEASLLLCQELKGYVENPNFYFDNTDAATDAKLDMLMLTQGWRRYSLDSIMQNQSPRITHDFEDTQCISGCVERTLQKHPKGFDIMLFYKQRGAIENFSLGDSSRFCIRGLDFVDGESFILQAVKDGNAKMFTQLYIDQQKFPQLSTCTMPVNTGMALSHDFITQASRHHLINDMPDYHLLHEIEAVAKRPIARNRTHLDPKRILTDERGEIERFNTTELLVRWIKDPVNKIYMGDKLFEPQPVVYIDDFRSDFDELIFTINPSQIERVEYFGPGDSRLLIYGNDAATLGCLFVYTRPIWKQNAHGAISLSMESVSPLGYQMPVEFYSPKYPDPDKSAYPLADQRTTLFWHPALKVGADGVAHITFYNSDIASRYLVTIEGIADSGEIVSRTVIVEP